MNLLCYDSDKKYQNEANLLSEMHAEIMSGIGMATKLDLGTDSLLFNVDIKQI